MSKDIFRKVNALYVSIGVFNRPEDIVHVLNQQKVYKDLYISGIRDGDAIGEYLLADGTRVKVNFEDEMYHPIQEKVDA